MRSLKHKVVVLTGASSGIGRATALALAAKGAKLHLVARRQRLLESVCVEARALGCSATPHALDVRDTDAYSLMADQVHAEHGRVDVLINNAGVGVTKSFMETSADDWEWIFDTNLHAVVHGIRMFLPTMISQGDGTIVNVASLAGVMANTLAAYSASKFAVVGMSESLLLEYGSKGLKVVVVCPGVIDTEIATASIVANRANSASGPSLQKLLAAYGAPPELVARDIVKALHRPRFMVPTPMHATVLRGIHRMVPELARMLIRRLSQEADGG
ncbi:SDR family NAD(P)-dependent oxidoreductase [Enhygromyxa salina]|uniref:SDR family NAD(P)-dependent oxidoreductase n=1 Tax=Enhygromyxa salina TaxID=215803 RepID=UPI000698B11B|nr:SDR family NAD(P)-dependent oxidoreductase [Enhygromyxa salina]